MSTLQEIAQRALEQFEPRMKKDGSKIAWFLKEGREEWVQDMVREAHDDGDLLPDDWRYKFITEALSALTDHYSAEEARDSLEADVYTHDLLQWFSSNLNRSWYCDEVSREYGIPAHEFQDGTIGLLAKGQLREKQEVFDRVTSFLRDKLLEEDV